MQDPVELVRDRLPESTTVEFKRDLPGNADRDRHEFLKDVCGFANSGGGTIYYGIGEQQGTAATLSPITEQTYDDVARRLGQIIDAGIEPRLRNTEFRQFDQEDGFVLGIRIAPSLGGPHRLIHGGHSKFVVRNNTHSTEMSYDQLRQAFNRSGSLVEQAKRNWQADWMRAGERRTWKPLPEGPICFIQFVPLVSVEDVQLVNVQEAHSDFPSFMFSSWGGASHTFNLDGVAFYYGGRGADEIPAFTQVYRTGKLDALRSASVFYREEKLIPSQSIAEFFREAIQKFAAFAEKYEIPAPYVINAALLDAEGYRLALDNRYFFLEALLADRKHLILPTIYFEENFSERTEEVSKELLDVLWQCFGVASCTYYNNEGQWIAR
jgi:hypothetical protein